ncbi:MAG: NAD(P)/FAD-dependent oxidoreductase [Prevotella sp.]|jgi:phytoene dehydrogenase-like protein|nr:NAD(P)/FAD-dependent oxidoreductase [Prevotella sp.]
MQKKVVIIGAGISGMIAGIYARKMGFETEMYESHTIAGGLCTGWQRKGYTVDGCIHWITGSKKGSDLYEIWKACGAIGDHIEVIHHDYIVACCDDGRYYYVYADLDKMGKEFLSISPEDEAAINELIGIVRSYQKLPLPACKPQELLGLFGKIKFYLPYIRAGKRVLMASKTSIGAYISRFRSPLIRQMLSAVVPNPELTANVLFFTLATFAFRDGGWPEGGSYVMAQRIKERYLAMEGRIYLGTPVKKIIVQNGKAIGIELGNRSEIKADYVVPTISADVLINQLLDGKYHDSYFERRYADNKKYQLLSSTLVALGVNTDIKKYPHSLHIKTKHPIFINQTKITELTITHYCHEPSLAPDGKSLIEVALNDSEFGYWRSLKAASTDDYKRAKEALAIRVIEEIEAVYPEIKGKVEMTDVATPLTFHRYCGTYNGSYMSFCMTPGANSQSHRGVIPGIQNMYPAGQWVLPQGGLPIAAIAGKFAIQRICKQENIKMK